MFFFMIFGCAGSSLLRRLSLVAMLRLLIAVASFQALGCSRVGSLQDPDADDPHGSSADKMIGKMMLFGQRG